MLPGILLNVTFVDAAVELGRDAGVTAPVGRRRAELFFLCSASAGSSSAAALKSFQDLVESPRGDRATVLHRYQDRHGVVPPGHRAQAEVFAVADQRLEHVIKPPAPSPSCRPSPPRATTTARALRGSCSSMAFQLSGAGCQHVGWQQKARPLVFIPAPLESRGMASMAAVTACPSGHRENARSSRPGGTRHRPENLAASADILRRRCRMSPRVARQITGIDQVAHQRIDRRDRGEHCAFGQRPDKRAPLLGSPVGLRPAPNCAGCGSAGSSGSPRNPVG